MKLNVSVSFMHWVIIVYYAYIYIMHNITYPVCKRALHVFILDVWLSV